MHNDDPFKLEFILHLMKLVSLIQFFSVKLLKESVL